MQELLSDLEDLKKDLHSSKFNKKLLIQIGAGILVFLALYSVFWYVKATSAKSQIESFLKSHQESIKFSNISLSGYPLIQKITIENISFEAPDSNLRYKTQIKKLEIKAPIFTSNFRIELLDKINLSNAIQSLNVEFLTKPKILLAFSDGILSNFLYEDQGYKVLDNENKEIYSAKNSRIFFESNKENDGKIKNKLNINISDLDGFDVLDFYLSPEENAAIGQNSDINFNLKATYELTPIKDANAQVSFSKVLQIENFNFKSAFFNFDLNGKLATFKDDNIPSGLMIAKVNNAVNFLRYVEAQAKEIDENKYKNIVKILKETAEKNDESNDNNLTFKIQREKNLEFLVNEVPLSYILQNLGAQDSATTNQNSQNEKK